MTDKNGEEIHIGDKIVPYNGEGQMLLIVSQMYVPEIGEECLFGQQIKDPLAFSPLPQDILSAFWILYKEEGSI